MAMNLELYDCILMTCLSHRTQGNTIYIYWFIIIRIQMNSQMKRYI